jgi:hypothetical protein
MFKVILNISNNILVNDENSHDHQIKVYMEEQIPSILVPPFMVPNPLAQNHIQDLTLKSPM